MTFVTAGLAIAGACAMAIPILIHLLWRQQRKPVQWAAMRFLLEAMRKHHRRLRMEQLILLALRCLLIGLIGFGLARPALQASGLLDAGGARTVWLVIDDGVASGVRVDGTSAFEKHQARARAIVESLDGADRVGLIAASRPAQSVIAPPSSDRASVMLVIDAMQPTSARTDLPAAFLALRGALEPAGEASVLVYLLSDFRMGSAPINEPLPTFLEERSDVVLFRSPPATESVTNVAVTDVDPLRSLVLAGSTDGSGQVTVRLARQGTNLAAQTTTVTVESKDLEGIVTRTVQWTPGQTEASVDVVLDLASQRDAEAGITVQVPDDALAADNTRHAVLALRRNVRATVIDRRAFGAQPDIDQLRASQWIARALEPSRASPIEVVEVEPAVLAPSDLRATDILFLPRPDLLTPERWATVRSYVDSGGVLFVSPPADANIHQWTSSFQEALDLPFTMGIEVASFDAGMPLSGAQPASSLLALIAPDMELLAAPVQVRRAVPIDASDGSTEVLLQLDDGAPLLVGGTPSPAEGSAAATSGLVLFLATAPELSWTNLPSKPLMVPLMQEVVRQGISLARAQRAGLVGDLPMPLPYRAAIALEGPGGADVDLDDMRRPYRPLQMPGLYEARDAGAQPVGTIAVNVDAAAGRTNVQVEETIDGWLRAAGDWTAFDPANVTAALVRIEQRTPIGRLLLVAVFVVAVLEALLARRFSHAVRTVKSTGVASSRVEAAR